MYAEILRLESRVNNLETEFKKLTTEIAAMMEAMKSSVGSTQSDILESAVKAASGGVKTTLEDFKSEIVTAANQSIRAELDSKLEVVSANILSKVKPCKCTSKTAA